MPRSLMVVENRKAVVVSGCRKLPGQLNSYTNCSEPLTYISSPLPLVVVIQTTTGCHSVSMLFCVLIMDSQAEKATSGRLWVVGKQWKPSHCFRSIYLALSIICSSKQNCSRNLISCYLYYFYLFNSNHLNHLQATVQYL